MKNPRVPRYLIPATALVVFMTMTMIPAFGQSSASTSKSPATKPTVTKGVKGTGTADSDPNIKGKSADNDPKAKIPPPPGKGVATRGPNPWPCRVNIDNRTPLKIQIYVDGSYSGLSSPWGDAFMNTGSGTTGFYALATFTDGSKVTWGPSAFACPAFGTYAWQLTTP